jgi:predicted GIY-YIG superfamily endonuclease
MAWYVYLARCADDTLYCGITNDVEARLAAHAAGKGAKYTRGRGPLELIGAKRLRDKGRALRLEHAVKQLTRRQKLALAATWTPRPVRRGEAGHSEDARRAARRAIP